MICMKNKKIIIGIIIGIAVILLFPIPLSLKDGGSIEFKAILYSITKYHQINHEVDDGYVDGIELKVLGRKVLDTRMKKTETITVTEERTKLENLKIEAEGVDTTRLVRFNNILYGEAMVRIDYAGDLDNPIGKIDYLIEEEYLPVINGETNCQEFFEAEVLEAYEDIMILHIKNKSVILLKAINEENIEVINIEENNQQTDEYSSFVGTILEETTTYMIVRPNDDESEIKSADKIIINYGTDHKDYLYGVGRKVVIKYKGYIKETYPAQIDTDNILEKGYEDFELFVKRATDINKIKILNNKELYKNNSDYDLYYYGLDEVNVKVDGKTLSLEKALKDGKLTIDGIIEKANKDVNNNIIKCDMYKEGGTMEYYYDTYTIIKKYSLDGNRDVYIGIPEMRNNEI